jgi:uncharacterized protein (TIGR02284 family)
MQQPHGIYRDTGLPDIPGGPATGLTIMLNKKAVKMLNHLIQASANGKMGFAAAAKDAIKPEVQTMLQGRSADCGAAMIELQALVYSLGGAAAHEGTVAAPLGRYWAKVKATIGGPDISVLKKLERAEYKIQSACGKAVGAKLSREAHDAVQHQHDGAVRSRNLIHDLRNSFKITSKDAQNAPFGAFRLFP